MEYDSGGVSVEAQLRGIAVSNFIYESGESFTEFTETITTRKKDLVKVGLALDFSIESKAGMFAWLTGALGVDLSQVFKAKGIKVMPGSGCGGGVNQCRINLGEPEATWTQFLKAVS